MSETEVEVEIVDGETRRVRVAHSRPELELLLARARGRVMTDAELQAQRESWVRSCAPEKRGEREAQPQYELVPVVDERHARIERAAAHVVKNKSRWLRLVRFVIRFLIRKYGL